MTAIAAIGLSAFAIVVLGLAVTLVVITRSIRQEEAGWTFSGVAPTRQARLTRRVLGAYCDPSWDWQEASRPERDHAGWPV